MKTNTTLLLIEIPRTNDKKELSAEQMLESLHGILNPKKSFFKNDYLTQDCISFEICSIGKKIRFYISAPTSLQAFIEGQIYTHYPDAQISKSEKDYTKRVLEQPIIYTSELTLTDNESLPIKSFPSFEIDPLANITATLAKLDQPNEEMWLQIIIRPISDAWHRKSNKIANRIKSGGGTWTNSGAMNYFSQIIIAPIKPPQQIGSSGVKELSERDKTRITAINEKCRKPGYQTKIRILYAGNNEEIAKQRMQAIIGTFKQFNTTNLNGFQSKYPSFDHSKISLFMDRDFSDKGYILNIEEIASIYHLPHSSIETPNIVWANTKTVEPPNNLPIYSKTNPKDLSLFGITDFRGTHDMFGILRSDRSHHMYIMGQTETGKSGLLELLTLSDIYYKQGFAILDPHGDYSKNILKYIPKERINDVVYINTADQEYPIALNPLELTDPTSKGQVCSELIGVLKHMFNDTWGPQFEYILRYTILALLDYPNATMLDITKLLSNTQFREKVLANCTDPVVKTFWHTEFANWNEKYSSETIVPILTKIEAFITNPVIRNIIGQPKAAFNIRKLMDEGKILIINLSKGLIGENNASILGLLFVNKIQLAAMSRVDMPNVADRKPFYLYIDEFQDCVTDSFSTILSESRKYGLNLTIANQNISQLPKTLIDTIFGNVGTILSFRTNSEDSRILIKYFEPQFRENDLSQLYNRQFVTSMNINSKKASPFSGSTLNIPPIQTDYSKSIIENSRQKYANSKIHVEATIIERTSKSKTQPQNAVKLGQALVQAQKHMQSHPIKSSQNSLAQVAVKNIKDSTIHQEAIHKISQDQKKRLKINNEQRPNNPQRII